MPTYSKFGVGLLIFQVSEKSCTFHFDAAPSLLEGSRMLPYLHCDTMTARMFDRQYRMTHRYREWIVILHVSRGSSVCGLSD